MAFNPNRVPAAGAALELRVKALEEGGGSGGPLPPGLTTRRLLQEGVDYAISNEQTPFDKRMSGHGELFGFSFNYGFSNATPIGSILWYQTHYVPTGVSPNLEEYEPLEIGGVYAAIPPSPGATFSLDLVSQQVVAAVYPIPKRIISTYELHNGVIPQAICTVQLTVAPGFYFDGAEFREAGARDIGMVMRMISFGDVAYPDNIFNLYSAELQFGWPDFDVPYISDTYSFSFEQPVGELDEFRLLADFHNPLGMFGIGGALEMRFEKISDTARMHFWIDPTSVPVLDATLVLLCMGAGGGGLSFPVQWDGNTVSATFEYPENAMALQIADLSLLQSTILAATLATLDPKAMIKTEVSA